MESLNEPIVEKTLEPLTEHYGSLSILMAFSLLGELDSIMEIIAGKHVHYMKCLSFYRNFNMEPSCVEELALDEVGEGYKQIVAGLREGVQDAILEGHKYAVAREQAEFRRRDASIREKFLEQNKKHESGTVKEIAERLGISISEVRRRKREGEL